MPNYRDLLRAAKGEIREVTTAEAEELRDAGAVILDVREPDEFEQGSIPGAVFIPRGHLESQVENRIPDKSARVVVHCAGGARSAFAAKTLAAPFEDVTIASAGLASDLLMIGAAELTFSGLLADPAGYGRVAARE